jgi:hypothetical protein
VLTSEVLIAACPLLQLCTQVVSLDWRSVLDLSGCLVMAEGEQTSVGPLLMFPVCCVRSTGELDVCWDLTL